VVRVIKGEKNWDLITVKSDETTVTGWTYARTLGKFTTE
jgi:hypothetical protein